MNFIKHLQELTKAQQKEIEGLQNGLLGLLLYVQSDKFLTCGGDLEGYVNVKDIVTRIREIQSVQE